MRLLESWGDDLFLNKRKGTILCLFDWLGLRQNKKSGIQFLGSSLG